MTKFHCLIASICDCNCLTFCDVITSEINMIFLIKPFFPNDEKVKTKAYIS